MPTMSETDADKELRRAVRRLNARAWGITGGLILAIGLFAATNILVFQDPEPGQAVGSHLGLLRYFFPGYTVTFVGSLVGFVYAFVVGYILGRGMGTVYNKLVEGFPS
jgi:ABC-type nitrate/sulfonate/bicarbonate transport system permease component